jgi:ketosteroid isomerase-like protein
MRSFCFVAYALALLTACKAPTTDLTAEQRAAIAAEVDSVAAEWWSAWEDADADRGLSFIADDAETAWTGDDGTTYTLAAISSAWRGWGEGIQGPQQIEFTDATTVVLAADVVCTIRRVTTVQTHVGGTTAPEFDSVETLIWVRRGGEWKVLIGHESMLQESWQARLDYLATREQ